MFHFADCWAGITSSVLDYDREPKDGYFALQRAMAPIQVLLELPDELRLGQELRCTIWIVNDFQKPFSGLTTTWTIANGESGTPVSSGEKACGIEANTVDKIATFSWEAKNCGDFRADLKLFQDSELIAENQYRLRIEADQKPES